MNALFSEYSQSIDTTINEKTEDPERSLLATLAKVLYTVQLSHITFSLVHSWSMSLPNLIFFYINERFFTFHSAYRYYYGVSRLIFLSYELYMHSNSYDKKVESDKRKLP